jgi:hypothetical protein
MTVSVVIIFSFGFSIVYVILLSSGVTFFAFLAHLINRSDFARAHTSGDRIRGQCVSKSLSSRPDPAVARCVGEIGKIDGAFVV